ncbi:tRNA (adenosine(37)-N6)-threonylcarbamoyltransferase complex dimerization subunit type 1 TsaB [Georgenia sp. TF02-10]|uniref:tRNA (adenosine(37)-N6)-threonylcarbamoyltransferase complex dimerization subunit type 1 TsaB n=1 Tax=Georgenia sp. TF02-10 TaxID=2917725 RepID=UPI001FA7E76F|nr:tRNA (adenosine(37)-N6)-threonylcarbamoyltransferase complex dimerization subunit type 1 TsaB [Georgenia sp. TF02-10]UNX54319.1 tRNA (adenosine(37)-N6)-threonylcarbamoyltransferase complex dimerization subunit type 1 TsaB [Georgenia sp. TF02-10]
MLLLCIDTSAGSAVALVDTADGSVVGAAESPDPRRHAEALAPIVAEVLAGRPVTACDAIAVGTGPAPFTGLRVGLVTAQALAHGAGLPVHGVSSLDLLARQALDALDGDPEVLVATDARRREVYWARYRARGADDVTRLAGPAVAAAGDVPVPAGAAVVGAGATLYPDPLPPTPGLPVRPDPAVLARIVPARLAEASRGVEVELGTEPRYLRRPDVHVPGARKRAS